MSAGEAVWEGKGVSVSQIESQMQRLYLSADHEWNGQGHRPDIRASVLNLVVYAPNQDCCDRTTRALEHLSGTHPSRAIIIVPGDSHAEPSIDARLSIHSHGAYAEFRQVCSEQMVLWIHGQATHHLASVVQPLLAPDLPVFVWWPGETPVHHHVYGQLRELADRFVVDSSDFAKPAADLVALSHSVRAAGARTAFSDFNWARLEPWRDLLAGFFDLQNMRPYLDRLQGISIQCARERDSLSFDLCQALLLAGWFGSALGLRTEQRDISENRYLLQLANGAHRLAVDITLTNDPKDPITIRLQAAGDPAAQFSLVLDPDSVQVAATVSLDGTSPIVRKTTMIDRDEGHLLFKELEVFGHDEEYERALHAAANMLDPNYHRELVKGSLLV
ncbi:MAG TPA: glucose-6-phosphate dehydrogenase assembly protein OpcA [Chloroflexota bacterium]|nr:glucose-6-phosphate dehydrogenase assembly protein OpcA [Chloroflexota bacterium]